MKVLVTGGAGFIGSNLVDRLLSEGHEVVVVDDLSTGNKGNVSPQATFYHLSIMENDRLAEVFKKEKPNCVCHLAAQIDVRKSLNDPVFDASVNILGGLNVIRNSLDAGIEKFVYVSTGGAIYGDPEYIPVDEKHPPQPLSPYGISKHSLEHYLFLYNALEGLKYTVLRFPNVYGPRQDPKGEAGVIAIFTDKMVAGERPMIFGDGKQTRDYTFVADVVQACILALEKGEGEILNIGTGKETTVLELVEALNQLLGTQLEPVFAPYRKGEVNRISLKADKAREVLGWESQYDILTGMKKTLEWHKTKN